MDFVSHRSFGSVLAGTDDQASVAGTQVCADVLRVEIRKHEHRLDDFLARGDKRCASTENRKKHSAEPPCGNAAQGDDGDGEKNEEKCVKIHTM